MGQDQRQVDFDPGTCRMEAAGDELVIRCESAKAQGLQVVKHIVEDHVVRFDWREKLTVEWSDEPRSV